jgi:hypothetical protein
MPDRLSAGELAGRAGQPPELVERLVALGIMAPDGDGLLTAGQVTLVDNSRIADSARPGEVLVSQEVLAACEHPGVHFEAIGEIPLKGVGTPVGLLRARPAVP